MLTDTKCRAAKVQDKPYKLADGKGLYLEVKPNGVKAWRYRFKLAREGAIKESVFAIGDYVTAPRKLPRPGALVAASPWPKHATSEPRRGLWSSRASTPPIIANWNE